MDRKRTDRSVELEIGAGDHDLLTDINKEGTAVLLVTHDANVAAQSGRVLFLRDGKIIDEVRFEQEENFTPTQRLEIVMKKMQEIGI